MIATLEVSGSAPPIPSIWRGSGDPIARSRNASRSAVSAGRSSATKKPPFDVPPRIHMQRVPSFIDKAHRFQLAAHAVNIEPEFTRREALALHFLIRLARLCLCQH